MLINYKNHNDENHFYVEIKCNLKERLKYLFSNKMSFVFDTKYINKDEFICEVKDMTYKSK